MDEAPMTFEEAVREMQALVERPDNDTLLRLYALHRQATQGDITGRRPGFFDFVGTAKYEAWSRLKGMSREAARRQYIELVRQLRR